MSEALIDEAVVYHFTLADALSVDSLLKHTVVVSQTESRTKQPKSEKDTKKNRAHKQLMQGLFIIQSLEWMAESPLCYSEHKEWN